MTFPAVMFVARHDRLVVTVSEREPSLFGPSGGFLSWVSSTGQTILERIRLLGRQPARDLAHDRNDLLHDITAGAAGSASQQILHRGPDLRLGVGPAPKLPIVLI